MTRFEEYGRADAPLPSTYSAWQVFGAGFENIGRDGKPVELELRPPAEDEILLRVDALGLCLSDIKIVNLGGKHPRLRGRDLAHDPTVLGHEAAVTVAAVGAKWKDRFGVGERYIVQADIYYKGLGYAFGYLIPGGLAQYCYLDERALDGDEGCYLLPVKADTGYSQAALAEPWACVEMSYSLDDRLRPGCGDLLIVTDDPAAWEEANPDALILPPTLDTLADDRFDDIILTSPTAELVNALAPRLRKNGAMFLLGFGEDAGVTLDIGRIHYDGLRFYGGGEDMEAVEEANARHTLRAGGGALFIGAGGPMGQMHVQRAIEVSGGPKRVVVTDLDRARLDHIAARFDELARGKQVELITLSPSEFEDQGAMDARLRSLAPDGYDDVVVLAPVASLVSAATKFAADNGLVNVFAGLAIGTTAEIGLRDLCRGVKIIGSSGSRIRDLKKVLDMVEDGKLNTNMSVAAIGGLNAAREGLEGVREARYPGKTVIYTQIPSLPLMSIEDIPEKLPEIGPLLGSQCAWTKEAEKALLENNL